MELVGGSEPGKKRQLFRVGLEAAESLGAPVVGTLGSPPWNPRSQAAGGVAVWVSLLAAVLLAKCPGLVPWPSQGSCKPPLSTQ